MTGYPPQMPGTDITLRTTTGRRLTAFLARPDGAADDAPLPAVLVVHEAMGLNDDMRRIASVFADHGYVTLAPDLVGAGFKPLCIARFFQGIGKVGTGRAVPGDGGVPGLAREAALCRRRPRRDGGLLRRWRVRDAVRSPRRPQAARRRAVLRRAAVGRVDHSRALPHRRLVRWPRRRVRQERPEARGRARGGGHPPRRQDLSGRRALVHERPRWPHGRRCAPDADALRVQRAGLGRRLGASARLLRRAPRAGTGTPAGEET